MAVGGGLSVSRMEIFMWDWGGGFYVGLIPHIKLNVTEVT